MSWQLDIRPPGGGTIRTTYTHETPGGITGGFEWSRRADGHCIQLRFQSTGSDIHPRDILTLWVDGFPSFGGTVIRCPHEDDPDGGEVLASVDPLIKDSLIPDIHLPGEQDVAAKALLLTTHRHPALNATSGNFPDTAKILDDVRMSYITLAEGLEALAETVPGVRFGADHSRHLFFREPTGNTGVAYDEAGLSWLPIQAEEIRTAITVIVASVNQHDPDVLNARSGYRPHVAAVRYEDDAHSTYAAEATAELSQGVEPFKPRYEPDEVSANVSNANNAWDGDMDTFAHNTSTGQFIITYDERSIDPALFLGFRVVYTTDPQPTDGDVSIEFVTGAGVITGRWHMHDADGRVEAIFLPPHPLSGITGMHCRIFADWFTASDQLRVYDFHPLILDEDLVKEMAKSKVRLPAAVPREIVVDGIIEPVKQVTVTGAPGGDVSGDVREFRYSHSSDRTTTTMLMEQGDTAEDAQLLRIIPQELDRRLANRMRPHLTFGRR